MAKIELNPLFAGLRGRVGNLIYRQIGDQTFVSALPRPSRKPPSPAQLACRQRFAAAARARAVASRPPEATGPH